MSPLYYNYISPSIISKMNKQIIFLGFFLYIIVSFFKGFLFKMYIVFVNIIILFSNLCYLSIMLNNNVVVILLRATSK